MKTVAVIGAGSALGAELAGQLCEAGVEVLRIGRRQDCDLSLDLDDALAVLPDGLPRVDVVFHCAAAFADDSDGGRWSNGKTNVLGCFNVLRLMQQLQCKACIYAGSLFSTPGVEVRGRSGYGLSKALGEQVLAWGLTESRPDGVFCSLRLPQLYDVMGRCCQHQPWLGRIVAYASRGLDLNMPPSGGPRNFLHMQDAARLLIHAWQEGVNGTWDVVHPESLDYQQIAQCAYDVFGAGGHLRVAEDKQPFRTLNLPSSGGALFDQLRIWPEISMERGLTMIRDAGHAGAFGPMDVT